MQFCLRRAQNCGKLFDKKAGETEVETDGKRQLYLQQKELLDRFLATGAISQAQYDKSFGDLTEKMGMGAAAFSVRPAETADLPRMLAIYERARRFMAEHGNPTQWGPRRWPPEELLREDIATGHSYVCVQSVGGAETVVGTFAYFYGDHVDPTYAVIEDGTWSADEPYGVVHRVASDGTRGVGTFCLRWAMAHSGYVRIDTHGDNRVMQSLLQKLGFRRCGIIHVYEDRSPRIAFDKIERK